MRAGIGLLEGLKSWDPANVGPFKLLGVLGNGGFGRVYLGQAQDGQRVAVKVIKPDLAEDPEFRARFGREVSAARKVGGKFTARVVDADTDSEELWLATEYISGPTLREAVADQGPLAESSVLALAAGLAEALGAIHAAGLVHRDLKPDNVLLAYDGPRVIDFGIARVAGASTLTGTGVLMGTLAYMSPEQAIGQSVGPPSDVFSLASVLVFAATGRGPYGDGTQAELLYRVAHQMPSLDGVPPQVRALVEPCMAADPERRPTTSDLVEHLGGARPAVGWLRTETIAAVGPHDTAPMTAQQPHRAGRRAAGPPVRGRAARQGRAGRQSRAAPPRARRSRLRVGVIAVAAVVVVGLAVGFGVSHFGGHHTDAAATWSGGQRIDTADGLTSVSCASADFCAAADSGGNAFTYSGGSWSAPQQLSSNGLSWVSCPTAGFCVATSNGSLLYTYSGGKWSSPTELFGDNGKPAHLTSVSCATATFCMATGNMHAYKYSGGTWARGVLVERNNKLAAISCASAHVLRRRRFGRERLYLLGQLVVRAPSARRHRNDRGVVPDGQLLHGRQHDHPVRVLRWQLVAVGPAAHRRRRPGAPDVGLLRDALPPAWRPATPTATRIPVAAGPAGSSSTTATSSPRFPARRPASASPPTQAATSTPTRRPNLPRPGRRAAVHRHSVPTVTTPNRPGG